MGTNMRPANEARSSRVTRLIPACRVVAVVALIAAGLLGCTFGKLSRSSPLFTPAPPAPEGYATLFIFRPWNDAGSAVWPVTFINDAKVADVEASSYTYLYVRPGKYHLRCEKSQFLTQMGTPSFDFTIPSPGTYYLQFDTQGSSFTLPAGRTFVTMNSGQSWDWQIVSEQQAMTILKKMRFLPPYTQTLGH